jgi:hypothetical protein
MQRSMVWIDGLEAGWSCSNCTWKFPIPTLLSSKDARDAYDRLAGVKFDKHQCEESSTSDKQAPGSPFDDRARMLIMRGFTPKVAVDIVLHEMQFENRQNPAALAKAHGEAEAFLERIRKGLI